MVTSITLADREKISEVHVEHPNCDNSNEGYLKQGREYYKNGVTKFAAKYPADTWVGNFRLLGWYLEWNGVEATGEVREGIDVGTECKYQDETYKVLAFGDGKVLLSNVNKYDYVIVPASDVLITR
ncbi:hypothetical protein [Vibrio crassostreae]|uniref:hypothetical protein n=1 Tax=Vibrio crassostreae TaxID=246167 RepID=UPI001B309A30|nr:hypothetical protein [Vibrio crassostreae]